MLNKIMSSKETKSGKSESAEQYISRKMNEKGSGPLELIREGIDKLTLVNSLCKNLFNDLSWPIDSLVTLLRENYIQLKEFEKCNWEDRFFRICNCLVVYGDYSLREMQEQGMSLKDLIKIIGDYYYYGSLRVDLDQDPKYLTEFFKLGYSYTELLKAGLRNDYFIISKYGSYAGLLLANRFLVHELIELGFSPSEIFINTGISPVRMLKAGVTVETLIKALLDFGYTRKTSKESTRQYYALLFQIEGISKDSIRGYFSTEKDQGRIDAILRDIK